MFLLQKLILMAVFSILADQSTKSPVHEQEYYGFVKACGKTCLICGKR